MTMNWTTLTSAKSVDGSVAFWVNYDRLDAESIVRDAENWIGMHLRIRRMRARAALTLLTGVSEIDLATEVPYFLDPIRLWMQGFGNLTFIHEDEIDEKRAADEDGALTSSSPGCWTVSGSTLLLDTEADQSYQLVLSHYAKPAPLSLTNQTNLYTEEYPILLRHVATGLAYIEYKDEARATGEFGLAQSFIDKIAENDDLARRGMEFTVRTT